VKRVSDLIYQARLDAVKKHEGCDDNQARDIELTEEQYLKCRLDWGHQGRLGSLMQVLDQ